MSPQALKQQQDWRVVDTDEASVVRLAERIALKLAVGDLLALSGTPALRATFARALVRALLGDPGAEVPSPIGSRAQIYTTPRLALAHLDLHAAALSALDTRLADGAVVVEIAEPMPGRPATNRLDIHVTPGALHLTGHGTWVSRLARLEVMSGFLDAHPPWDAAMPAYLQGDASARAYARLGSARSSAILMDQPRQPDGPPIRNGLPYSRIAKLAEDVRPFVAVASALREAELSAPEIYATDLDRGFLVLEDFGDRVFGAEIENGTSQAELWRAATDTLIALARVPVPGSIALPDGTSHHVPRQDAAVLGIEVELLPDWYWRAIYGAPVPSEIRAEFMDAWQGIFARLASEPAGWVLRDYHSPNLVWLPERDGPRRAGLLDFQDALCGSAAYDLVSLLEDARLDVPPALEDELLAHYLGQRGTEPAFDRDAFSFAYAALGVQRNTKILGIFARLAMRDGKHTYLRHIPRLWRYLARGLAHPELAALARWFDRHLPDSIRHQPPAVPLPGSPPA
ncbi:phosphotransferase [uncultured Hyphomicrobium sp.]|uniref:phosphotransferase n=1 Tax=uncultured Hyphomicrobium sp. TaxID=194373 RepID=UPI0025F564A7|nr:phosphotransferase [uncultured Hyphomicrobium sp.]